LEIRFAAPSQGSRCAATLGYWRNPLGVVDTKRYANGNTVSSHAQIINPVSGVFWLHE